MSGLLLGHRWDRGPPTRTASPKAGAGGTLRDSGRGPHGCRTLDDRPAGRKGAMRAVDATPGCFVSLRCGYLNRPTVVSDLDLGLERSTDLSVVCSASGDVAKAVGAS